VSYRECCTVKARNRMAWLIIEVWKLRGIRRNMGRVRFPLCLGENAIRNILLSFTRIIKWRMEFISKIAGLKEDVASKKMIY
jgi:hypothetical protein